MRARLSVFAFLSVTAALTVWAPNEAHACGGCFPPPGESNSVVTDHRMVLSVSPTQSSLYDQIQFTGNPKEFAWVLPISGTVDVGLSADSLFGALQNMTGVVVQEPPRNCPPPPVCQDFGAKESNSAAGGSSSGGFGAQDGGAAPPVDVLKKEVVGPYETVQLKSESGDALTGWLTQNGYNIPEDVKPIINQYVAEKFNFLALRLKPGEGINSMRPVRVTTQGASPVLPLRMVAAGTGANVGITLWVVSEGRYEPQNFQSFVIKNDDLTWDWNSGSSDYKTIRADKSNAQPGKTWEVESSIDTTRDTIERNIRFQSNRGGQPGGDYLPVEDSNGGITKTAQVVQEEDLTALLKGIPLGQEHLTRMRADLSRAALATDLTVIASQDQADIPIIRVPKKENGQPLCPIYRNCEQVGQLPRDQAKADAAANSGGGETFTCQTARRDQSSLGGIGVIAAFLGLAFLRSTKDRKNRK
jgi:hypothetical protein